MQWYVTNKRWLKLPLFIVHKLHLGFKTDIATLLMSILVEHSVVYLISFKQLLNDNSYLVAKLLNNFLVLLVCLQVSESVYCQILQLITFKVTYIGFAEENIIYTKRI